MARVRAALTIGAERVRIKYGFRCPAALRQLAEPEVLVATSEADAMVQVLPEPLEKE